MRHLRRNGVTRDHIKQVQAYLKWIVQHTDMKRLADFNEDRIDRALGMIAAKGRSPRTVNVYRRCAHSFCEWCMKVARVLDRNPVAVIGLRNEAADRRKVRRSLSIDEARRLLSVCGLRRLFYAVQLWTGLRVSEVRALQWSDLDLLGDRPILRLRAEATKSRRADELPLHPSLVTLLAASKPDFAQPSDPVFQTTPILRTFKEDLVRAGVVSKDKDGKIVTTDARGNTLDRHALRTTFISWLGQYGVDPRAQMKLARHAPRGVTFRNYQDFAVFDLWMEIRKLPGITPDEPHVLKATGTCDMGPVVPQVVPTAGIRWVSSSVRGTVALTPSGGRGKKPPLTGSKPRVPMQNDGRAISSVGQSACSTRRRSEVQVLYRPVGKSLRHRISQDDLAEEVILDWANLGLRHCGWTQRTRPSEKLDRVSMAKHLFPGVSGGPPQGSAASGMAALLAITS